MTINIDAPAAWALFTLWPRLQWPLMAIRTGFSIASEPSGAREVIGVQASLFSARTRCPIKVLLKFSLSGETKDL